MFSPIVLATLLAAIASARADPNPSVPGPGDVYNEGSNCQIEWDADTTGTWKTMNIELMTGSNLGMVHITTVTTVDGTDPTKTTYTYPCPQVTPNSAIYFYQFTSPSSKDTLWTTRFAIADANGKTTPPTEATEPDGQAIPWGTGALVDPSLATPPPGQGATVVIPPNNSSTSSSSGSSAPAASGASSPAALAAPSSPSSASTPVGGSSGLASPPASAPSGLSKVSASSSGVPSSSGSSSAGPAPTGGAAANGAVSMLVMDLRVMQAAATLGLVAFAYAVAL